MHGRSCRRTREPDRVLATILYTDIFSSTERAAAIGDERRHRLLDAHDAAVRRQLVRYRGREVNTTGDGFVAAFDGAARAIQCALEVIADCARPRLRIRHRVHRLRRARLQGRPRALAIVRGGCARFVKPDPRSDLRYRDQC